MIRDYTPEELCAKIDEIGAFDYIQFISVPTNEYDTPINSTLNFYNMDELDDDDVENFDLEVVKHIITNIR